MEIQAKVGHLNKRGVCGTCKCKTEDKNHKEH